MDYISKKDMAKKIEKMSLEELVAGEKAASTVRKFYEDKMVIYRGIDHDTMNGRERQEYTEMSQRFGQINAIRLKIINEIETRLLEIE